VLETAPAPEAPEAPPTPPMVFSCEDFRASIQEAMPMIVRHGEELGLTELPWPFRPAFNVLADTCNEGRGVWITARDREGTMIGYALFMLGPGLFLRDTLVGTCVALYVTPEWRVRGLRPVGLRFLQFCEAEMRRRGVGLVEIAAMEGSSLAGFLPKLAYRPVQTVLWKNLEETTP